MDDRPDTAGADLVDHVAEIFGSKPRVFVDARNFVYACELQLASGVAAGVITAPSNAIVMTDPTQHRTTTTAEHAQLLRDLTDWSKPSPPTPCAPSPSSASTAPSPRVLTSKFGLITAPPEAVAQGAHGHGLLPTGHQLTIPS